MQCHINYTMCVLSMDFVEQFRSAMQEVGITCNDQIIPDGRIHRFRGPGERRGKKAGWYILFGDGIPAGAFGDWREGKTYNWCSKASHELTERERQVLHEQLALAKRQRDEELKRLKGTSKNGFFSGAESKRWNGTAFTVHFYCHPFSFTGGIVPYFRHGPL